MAEANEEDRRNGLKLSIANGVMTGTFLALSFSINPHNRDIGLTVVSWIIFALAVASVDFLLYRHFHSKPNKQKEKPQP